MGCALYIDRQMQVMHIDGFTFLLQMLGCTHYMAVNVEVLKQKTLINGLRLAIQGTTARAEKTLVRVFKVHPIYLKRETGWNMKVERYGKQFIVTTTTEKPEQVQKIIALNYIGLMAYGKHHQVHHWGMSTGQNLHAKQH